MFADLFVFPCLCLECWALIIDRDLTCVTIGKHLLCFELQSRVINLRTKRELTEKLHAFVALCPSLEMLVVHNDLNFVAIVIITWKKFLYN